MAPVRDMLTRRRYSFIGRRGGIITGGPAWLLAGLSLVVGLLTACQAPAATPGLPTLAPTAVSVAEGDGSPAPGAHLPGEPAEAQAIAGVPPTWTPPPLAPATASPGPRTGTRQATTTPLPIPTHTPIPPTPTPTVTPTETRPATATPDVITAELKPLGAYRPDELVHLEAFPRPPGDNGWGMHWIPTVKQERWAVDRFVVEAQRMHIKWVVFLNDGTNIGDNDYLVDRLVAAGIMPVMRLYRSGILPYDGSLGAMIAYYRARGVYYFQLYNEPNVNDENHQAISNPNQYAAAWAAAARDVVAHGGLPGIGALSPGGAYNHYTFLERSLQALEANGDAWLLNRAWLSVHNYHGLRAFDDPDGFLLFRRYDAIVQRQLRRSLPMIGTEGGSYASDTRLATEHLAFQYTYMRQAEPYFLAHSYWLIANQEGGGHDLTWEWQALFRRGFVHPVVTDFFYANRE